MKIRLSVVAFASAVMFMAPLSGHAQYSGPSAAPVVSVEEILQRPIDDQEVQLQGHLLRQVGAKTYIFSDGTAEIVAEIKAKRFEGLPAIDDKTKVEIFGEVDTSLYRAPEIEVDLIRIVK